MCALRLSPPNDGSKMHVKLISLLIKVHRTAFCVKTCQSSFVMVSVLITTVANCCILLNCKLSYWVQYDLSTCDTVHYDLLILLF